MFEVTEKHNPVEQVGKIRALQESMRELPQLTEELRHHFCDGLYGREMRVPAGTVLVGRTHKKPCFNFILEGEVEVRAPERSFRVKAPHFFISEAGTKRAMAAITDLVWMTVHPAETDDLETLESELVEDDL